tara:strand:- start:86371 stop:86958 length:588 start_codon:yes stop_codon:yes gene_type:complete
MEPVDRNSYDTALRVLNTAFQDNPGVMWVVKKDQKITSRIRELCRFCLTVSMEKEGAFITSDRKGVILMIESDKRQRFTNWLKGYKRLGQYCIGWDRAVKMINRERKIQSRRPGSKHLYVWMIAVEDHTYGLNTIREMRDFLFETSIKRELSIYAETTMKSTLNLYLRYGFEVYDTWHVDKEGMDVYFIRRDWKS